MVGMILSAAFALLVASAAAITNWALNRDDEPVKQ